MKSPVLLTLILCPLFLFAQTFIEVPGLPLDGGIIGGSIVFADVDDDGDKDALITGYNDIVPISMLYTNDGTGTFTISEYFIALGSSSAVFADVDNDGDQDVIIAGMTWSGANLTLLYTNNGVGEFTEVTPTPFDGASRGAIAVSDVDNDGDKDVLITGLGVGAPSNRIAKLYINDGTGGFIEESNTPFEGVYESAIAFADVDDDGDEDVLITGNSSSAGGEIAKLYTNDGTGDFTEESGTPFPSEYVGSIAFADVDGDADQDVLMSGQYRSKLYVNDGTGGFTEVSGTPFSNTGGNATDFSDIDDDGDVDVLITGRGNAELYINDGTGGFTHVIGAPFEGVSYSSLSFIDLEGDGDEDVLITGLKNSLLTANIYVNDGAGEFKAAANTPFDHVRFSSIAVSDVDGDGDSDFFLTGTNNVSQVISKLYLNDGTGTFTEVYGPPFETVSVGSVAFADVDSDGDEDLLITGFDNAFLDPGPLTKLYLNDGTGEFIEDYEEDLEDVWNSSIAFADVDGDGDKDLLITGTTFYQYNATAKLYTNDGSGGFTEVSGTPFEDISGGSVAFSDIDGDSDLDLLLTGYNGDLGPITKLYINDGLGEFTEESNTPFVHVASSSIAFSDVDGDGDQDVLIMGDSIASQFSSHPITHLYTNDGAGGFTKVEDTPFPDIKFGSIAFADVNDDGDEDLLLSGRSLSGSITKLYTNDGFGGFTEKSGTPFKNTESGSIAFSDVNGDGRVDVFLTGLYSSGPGITRLYTNEGALFVEEKKPKTLPVEFTLYPNPSGVDLLHLDVITDRMSSLTIGIYDLSGRRLLQQEEQQGIGQQTIAIDISSLQKGTYLMLLEDGQRKGTRIFLVE